MGETSDLGAWTLSKLGNVIDAYVDRTINRPQVVHDSSAAYGVDSNGNLYNLGQTNNGRSTVSVGMNPLTLALIAVVVVLMVKK